MKHRAIHLNDHVEALIAHGGEGIVDTVLANDGPLPIQMVEQYSAVGSEPVVLDTKKLQAKRNTYDSGYIDKP